MASRVIRQLGRHAAHAARDGCLPRCSRPHLCRLLGRDLLAQRLGLLQDGGIEGFGGLGQLLDTLDGRIGDGAKAGELIDIHRGYQRVIQVEVHCVSMEGARRCEYVLCRCVA